DRARRIAQTNLRLLEALFDKHVDQFHWVRPAGGMTAFPWLASGGNAREFCKNMARHGVLLTPGDCFGMPAHFRVGFAGRGESFGPGIRRLAEVLKANVLA